MSKIYHLSDLNPEILKLPPHIQEEFNNRFMKDPSAEYLALRVRDFIRIIAEEKEKLRNEEIEKARNLEIKKTINQELQNWQSLYQQEFNLDISQNLESLYIPDKLDGFNWLIIIHKSLKPNQIYNKLTEKFNCYKYIDNLDNIETIALRQSSGQAQRPNTDIYAIWIRDIIEADEEHKNKSANQIEQEGINPITLEERLLLELFYWRNTKKHLDLYNWTLCAGSRRPLGGVPCVSWGRDDRGRGVGWCVVSDSDGDIRVRQAISA